MTPEVRVWEKTSTLDLQGDFMLGQMTLGLRWWALTANLGAHKGVENLCIGLFL